MVARINCSRILGVWAAFLNLIQGHGSVPRNDGWSHGYDGKYPTARNVLVDAGGTIMAVSRWDHHGSEIVHGPNGDREKILNGISN